MLLGFEISVTVLPVAARTAWCGQILDRAGAGGLRLGRGQPFDGAALCGDMTTSFSLNEAAPRPGGDPMSLAVRLDRPCCLCAKPCAASPPCAQASGC